TPPGCGVAGGLRLSVPRRCSIVFRSTPLGPTTRAPSVRRTAVPSTLIISATDVNEFLPTPVPSGNPGDWRVRVFAPLGVVEAVATHEKIQRHERQRCAVDN